MTDAELIFAAANMANSSPTSAWYSDWVNAVMGADHTYLQLKRRLRGRRRFWLFGRRLGAGSQLPPDVWKYFTHLRQDGMDRRAMEDELLHYGRNVTLIARDKQLQAFLANMNQLTQLARSIVPWTNERPDASAAARPAAPAAPAAPASPASSSFRNQAGGIRVYDGGARRAERAAPAQIPADGPSPQGGGDVMIDWIRTKLSTFKTNVVSARSELAISEGHLRAMNERLSQAYEQILTTQRRLEDMSAGTDEVERATLQWSEHLVSRDEYERLQQHAQHLKDDLAAKGQQLTEAEQKLGKTRDQLTKVMQDRESHVIRNRDLTKDLATRIIAMLDDLSTLPAHNGATAAAAAQDGRGGERDDSEAGFLMANQQTLLNSLLAMLDTTCYLQPIKVNRLDRYDQTRMSQMGGIPSPDGPQYRGLVADVIRWGYVDRQSRQVFRPATVSVYE